MKVRSCDWVRLAAAALDARDLLRESIPALDRCLALQVVRDREACRLLSEVRVAVIESVERLRLALKRG
jgi:hypothetical protein